MLEENTEIIIRKSREHTLLDTYFVACESVFYFYFSIFF